MEQGKMLCLVSLVIYLVAMLFFLCGLGGAYWLDFDGYHQGLWKACGKLGSDWECVDIKLKDMEDWFKATVAMMILGLLCAAAGGLAMVIKPVSSVLQCVAGVFALIAIIIYADKAKDAKAEDDLGWAFALTAVAGCLFIANGIFLAFLAKKEGCNMSPSIPCRA